MIDLPKNKNNDNSNSVTAATGPHFVNASLATKQQQQKQHRFHYKHIYTWGTEINLPRNMNQFIASDNLLFYQVNTRIPH